VMKQTMKRLRERMLQRQQQVFFPRLWLQVASCCMIILVCTFSLSAAGISRPCPSVYFLSRLASRVRTFRSTALAHSPQPRTRATGATRRDEVHLREMAQ
jgi:hypothetical protein